MSGLDRARRRIDHVLEDGEGLLGSVVGLEERDGLARRKVAVIATDRRLLLVWLRPGGQLLALPYEDVRRVEVSNGTGGHRLEVDAEQPLVVRSVTDERALELLSTLVTERLGHEHITAPPPKRVRLLSQ